MDSAPLTLQNIEKTQKAPVSTEQRYSEFLTLMETEDLLAFVKAASLEEFGSEDYKTITYAQQEIIMDRLRQMLVVVRHMRSHHQDA